jgi:hypothetical protein
MQSQKLAIITTSALLLAISTVSTLIPESASAYEKNQATSQTSACGNEFIPINIGCQNTDSQIQGDENAAALTAQQTFPEVKLVQEKPSHPPKTPPPEPEPEPEPQTCIECFTAFLTPEQIAYVTSPGTLEELCAIFEGDPPNLQMQDLTILGNILRDTQPDIGLPLSETTIEQLIDCLERVLGLQTEAEPIES